MTTKTKERSIFLRDWEVLAIREGRKTTLRRPVTPEPPRDPQHQSVDPPFAAFPDRWTWWGGNRTQSIYFGAECPFGRVGDSLWVKETWATVPIASSRKPKGENQIIDPNDPHSAVVYAAGHAGSWQGKWKSQAYMPRWASRLSLPVAAIRVQQLKDFTEAEAIAEGMQFHDGGGLGHSGWRHAINHGTVYSDPRVAYRVAWEEVYGEGSFDPLRWVWVLEFPKFTK